MDNLSRNYQTALLTGPESYPNTWQLMNTMNDLALLPVMHFKDRFARARPSQIDPRIEPLIDVPGHPSFPSGHSTQNFLIAHLLSEVIGDDAELIARVFAIARRVAENREWAGVHYHSDTEAGESLARDIFPNMKQVFATPIKEAIEEWQELKPEEARPAEPGRQWDDPFPESHFRRHQWNLENHDRRGLDINLRAAWEQLHVWQGEPAQEPRHVRVALIDLAVDLEHPALLQRFDRALARNLDYPNVAQEGFVEAFRSASSAHAIACAGIIAADALKVKRPAANGHQEQDEPGCLGIAPHCTIIPYRAMTLTEPVMHKRQILARAVLEAATGVTFDQVGAPAGRWTAAGKTTRPAADILFLPLPLEPLPDGQPDPLALALAFAATRMPVIIPCGNKGTSSLGYLSDPAKGAPEPASVDDLSKLLDLDRAGVQAVFGAPGRSDQQIIEGLLLGLRREAAAICVGACNDRGRRSRYSQYGEGLTVVAPSDDVHPAQPVKSGAAEALPRSIATTDLVGIGGYMQDQSHYTLSDNEFGFGGTSAAGAQVTGVVALMLEANPRLRPTEVREILRDTARVRLETPGDLLVADDGQMPSQPSAEFGYGLVDAARAVDEACRRAQQGGATGR
jgi:hypothetical protein